MGQKKRRTNKHEQMGLSERRVCGGRQRQELMSEAAVDRLSDLPDEVLLCIVSHLPIREVVRMSILSRRWRRLPSILPVIDVDFFMGPTRQQKREGFGWYKKVDITMSECWGMIRRFYCSPRVPEANDQWAKAIARTGVRELQLEQTFGWFDAYPLLHHCQSLTKLILLHCTLAGERTVHPLRRIRCTDLRDLSLSNMHICNDVFQDLISTCPRLERIVIWECSGLACLRIDTALCLRVLEFELDSNEIKCSGVEIDAPNLEDMRLSVLPCEKFTIRAPKLTSMFIHLEEDKVGLLRHCRVVAEGLRRVMSDATNLLSLHLHGSSLQCLSLDPALESFQPSFQSLTRLSIHVSLLDDQQSLSLVMLLHHSNHLKELEIHMINDGSLHNEVPFHHTVLFSEHQQILERMDCLSHHLQEVTMVGLTGQIYEMKLACFLLMAACALKKFTLKFCNQHTKAFDIIEKHLTNLRRGSSEAKLELIYEDSLR